LLGVSGQWRINQLRERQAEGGRESLQRARLGVAVTLQNARDGGLGEASPLSQVRLRQAQLDEAVQDQVPTPAAPCLVLC
jgi:hypothetical protein